MHFAKQTTFGPIFVLDVFWTFCAYWLLVFQSERKVIVEIFVLTRVFVCLFRPEEPFEFPISAEKSVSISVKTFFFIMEITCFWAEKPFEFPISAKKSISILNKPMKIWVKVAYSCHTFSKKPLPFRNPGCAPDSNYS